MSAAQSASRLGRASIGSSIAGLPANVKQVNRYALAAAGSVGSLHIFLTPTVRSTHSPPVLAARRELLKGLIYADTGSGPAALLGVSRQLTFTSTSLAGWYVLAFPRAIRLVPGNYWIGVITGASASVASVRFSKVVRALDYNANSYARGPSSPFGKVRFGAEQISLYASYARAPVSMGPAPGAVSAPAPPGGVGAPAAQAAPAVGALTPAPPSNTAIPTISGTVQQGQQLTASDGGWTNEPTGYSVQWLRCDSAGGSCATIAGAAGQSYTASAADVGHALRVLVVASNAAGGGGPAASEATAPVLPERPANIAVPTISGTAKQGQALTAHNGAWSNEPTSFGYQWLRCEGSGGGCATIASATSQSYTASTGDVDHALRVKVTASNAGGSSSPASSDATSAVLRAAPVNTGSPTISGTTKQDQTLTTSNGSWTGEPSGYSYQWLRCDTEGLHCSRVSAATAQTYTLSSSDVGWRMRTEVVASNAGGASPAAISDATGLVQPSSVQDPLLAAVGDIACPAGDSTHACQQSATASLAASQHPNAVAVLGDDQYESGTLEEFMGAGAYNDTWGEFNQFVHPAPGNHEYQESSSASGYFTYFGGVAGNGDYSYELGSWHIISLNSACSSSGCQDSLAGTTSTAAVHWLEEDLAAHPNQCILAYWHHPRFSSGFNGSSPSVAPFWNALYAAHADVVLGGHDHMYERFAQQDPEQKATSAGIREFVVGTGGESLLPIGTALSNSQFRDNKHFGVLFLTLHGESYEWAFRTTEGGSVLDSGSNSCHAQSSSDASLGQVGALALRRVAASEIRRGSASAARGASASTPRGASGRPPAHAALQARPALLAFGEKPLVFAAHLLRQPSTRDGSLSLEIHCSRGCDVEITLQVRHTTVARYRETEDEIRSSRVRLSLQLSPQALRRIGGARATATFVATDSANENRSVRQAVTVVAR